MMEVSKRAPAAGERQWKGLRRGGRVVPACCDYWCMKWQREARAISVSRAEQRPTTTPLAWMGS